VKRVLKWFGYGLLLAILAGFVPATQGLYGLYWKRWSTSLLGNPLDPAFSWYDPLESVAGNFSEALPVANPAENTVDPAVLEEGAAYAGAHHSSAFVVMHRGKIISEHYWNDFGRDTLFPAHSMTKSLPAILIGHAIADGFIESADVSASRFLPEWDTVERRGITIRHLLNMSSGIFEPLEFAPKSGRMLRLFGLDIVAANLAADVAGEPGRQWGHFNPNSQLLGVIVERATGRRFGEYLTEKLWAPLGAHEAFMYVDHAGGTVHTDCCMWATVEDWLRMGELLRNRGVFNGRQLIPASWFAEMVAPAPAYVNYGMQLWLGNQYEKLRRYDPERDTFANVHSEPYVADDVLYLDGLGKKRVYVIPSRELVILRVGPNDDDWDDAFLPNLLTKAIDATPVVTVSREGG
jgi:CubicO group peptidase (beta-lactamase class C family)